MEKYAPKKFSYSDTFQMEKRGRRAMAEATTAVAIVVTYLFMIKLLMISTTVILFYIRLRLQTLCTRQILYIVKVVWVSQEGQHFALFFVI